MALDAVRSTGNLTSSFNVSCFAATRVVRAVFLSYGPIVLYLVYDRLEARTKSVTYTMFMFPTFLRRNHRNAFNLTFIIYTGRYEIIIPHKRNVKYALETSLYFQCVTHYFVRAI